MTEIKELVEKLRALLPKAAAGPMSFVPQQGKPHHCNMAQVWGAEGEPVAYIEPTEDEQVASSTAELFAEASNALPQILDTIEALSSQVEELKAGWQPIETAPRDGTSIIVAVHYPGFARADVGEAYYGNDGNWSWANTSEHETPGGYIVTDVGPWMPMPDYPVQARSALSLEAGKE